MFVWQFHCLHFAGKFCLTLHSLRARVISFSLRPDRGELREFCRCNAEGQLGCRRHMAATGRGARWAAYICMTCLSFVLAFISVMRCLLCIRHMYSIILLCYLCCKHALFFGLEKSNFSLRSGTESTVLVDMYLALFGCVKESSAEICG